MFGISFEHILILGVILIIVGPRKLPELGNTMGKAIKNFKDSFSGIEEANFKRILTPEETPAAATATAQTANASPNSSPNFSPNALHAVNPSAEGAPIVKPIVSA